MQVSRLVAVDALLVLLAGCASADSTSSSGPIATEPSDASPQATATATATRPEPTVAPRCPGDSTGCPEQQPEPALGEPLTTVPDSVMLDPDVEQTGDSTAVAPWVLAYCGPDRQQPDATTMRSRSFRGRAATPETGPLEYTQQVAAFSSVDAAVAEAARLVDAAERCPAAAGPAGPAVGPLPLGTQARLVTFAEGGDYSIRGFFRRGNAIAVVQGRGGEAEPAVRTALNETFARLCVYDRPDGC